MSGPGHEPTYDTPPLVTARHESLQTSGAPGHYYADQVYSDDDSDDDDGNDDEDNDDNNGDNGIVSLAL